MEPNLESLCYEYWNFRHNRHRDADEKVLVRSVQTRESLLKSARLALYLSMDTVAERLNSNRSQIANFEKSEENGSISLNNLRKVASAMDCDIVYAVRPRSGLTFSQSIWKIVYPLVANSRFARNENLNAIANAVDALIESPQFRKRMKLNLRGKVSSGGQWRMFDNLDADEILESAKHKGLISPGCG